MSKFQVGDLVGYSEYYPEMVGKIIDLDPYRVGSVRIEWLSPKRIGFGWYEENALVIKSGPSNAMRDAEYYEAITGEAP